MAVLLKSIELPNLTIPGNIFLAPMAGYTDAAFRSLCVEQGASLCFTEMVSAEGLVRESRKTWELLARAPNEQLWAVQIFGSDARTAAAAVRRLESLKPSLYDLNCGCSVPKVLKSGAGAALLREPERIRAIIRAMRGETAAPVTMKIRSGWDQRVPNYREAAAYGIEGGAALVCLHPRSRAQGFGGRAEWSHLADLKRQVSVPVFGSGDLFSAEDAVRMMTETGCDGVMLARGAIGDPFLFARTLRLFSELPPLPAATAGKRLLAALTQLSLSITLQGESRACRQMRKHFSAYTKGIPGGSELRSRAVRAEREVEYRALVEEYLEKGRSDSYALRV